MLSVFANTITADNAGDSQIKEHKIRQLVCFVVLGTMFVAGNAVVWPQSNAEMQQRYAAFLVGQTDDSLPFTLESADKNSVISASVKTFLPDIAFSLFAQRLSSVAEWCEFIPLHLNVKACTYEMDENISKLGFYVGVKDYMTPDEAELLLLNFQADLVDNVLEVRFNAKTGPFGSSNHDFHIRAIEGDGGVYFEFDLSSEPGLVANLAKIYLATVARSKIGFSAAGETWLGKSDYVRGQRGVTERNIVRYLFSIRAYFGTIDSESTEQGYFNRLVWWFDLTTIYPRQLYEMSKGDYLAIKMRERKNHFILMDSLENNTLPVYELPLQLP